MSRRAADRPEHRPAGRSKATASAPAHPGPPRSLPLFSPALTDETIARVRHDFPGWDLHVLKGEFDAWLANGGRQPDDYQAAFHGFMRQHHTRHHRP